MVIIDNIPYFSVKNLIDYGFTQSFIDKQTSLGNYSCTYASDPEQPTRKEVKLIPYTSIPETTRIAKGIPSQEELIKQINQRELARLVHFNNDAYTYYLQNPATAKVAKEKAEQFSWYIAIATAKPSQVNALGFTSKDEFCNAAIKLMQERNWRKWKCSTLAELRKRLTPVKKYLKGSITLAKAAEKFISKKVNNINSEKLTNDQKALIVQLYSDANAKPNHIQVWNIYTRKANEMISLGHWREVNKNGKYKCLVSDSTIYAFLQKPAIRQLWYEARHGYQEYRNVFEPVTQRERPSFANALWVIDGTPSHRYFQHGDKGRYFRFNIFPILDAHSWCVLGFWLSETENTEAVLGALRSACWVSGHMPHQILYDNSSAIQSYRSQDAIDKISVVSFAATAGNARSKIIENFFHLFNQDVQKFRPGYTANPFAVSINNRPNREALAKMVKSHELARAEQALNQAIEDLTIWNNTPRKFLAGKSPLAQYRASVEATRAKQRVFSEIIDIEAFYQLPGEQKKIRTYDEGKLKIVNTFIPQQYPFTNRGIDITIGGKPFTYDIEDAAFRKLYIGQKFTVRHEANPERWVNGQPERLLLYINGAPLQWNEAHACALPKQLIPMAVADYQEGTRAQLNERLNNKKQQRAFVQHDFTQLIEHTKRNGTYTPVITDNAFDKQVLSDTTAQILNGIINDNEAFNTTEREAPASDQPKKLDRLSDEFDTPLPLD